MLLHLMLLAVTASLGASPVEAQTWSGILDSSRAIDWAANQPGVPGGIPTNRTQCGSIINAYSGSPTVINNAVASCPEYTYILLGPGTFNLTGSIFLGKSHVTLRGAGPDLTRVHFTGQSCGMFGGLVCIKGTSDIWAGGKDSRAWVTNWKGGYTKGTTQITVGSTTNTAAGRFIFLDQLDDQTDHGGIVNSGKINVFSGEGLPSFGRCDSADAGDNATGTNCRTQTHIHKVVSVDSATQLTITPGIQMPNYRSGQNPQMYGIGFGDSDVVSGVGLENMTLVNDGVANNGQNAIVEFANAYGSWAKNVRTINGLRDHFTSHQASHIEIRDCYLYGSTTSNSQSYGIESQGASDNLYINNIIHYVTGGFMGACPGCVIAYNYSFAAHYTDGGGCVDTGPNNYSTCNWAAAFNSHDSGGGMDLWEGNDLGSGMHSDLNHGNSPLATFFRNRLGGYDDNGVTSKYRVAAIIQTFGRGYNFIGNVLGTSAIHTVYQEGTATTSSSTSIFNIGYNSYGNVANRNDTIARTSLMRWGNYDTVNAAVRWIPSEVPTSGIPFINGNPVPSTQTLPSSFFLLTKPGWWTTKWGTPSWPPIGPDVTNGTMSAYAGHVHKIPARICFENLANDPTYSSVPAIKLFTASACYRENTVIPSTAPMPPTGLAVH